jgi:hypothetical protein
LIAGAVAAAAGQAHEEQIHPDYLALPEVSARLNAWRTQARIIVG